MADPDWIETRIPDVRGWTLAELCALLDELAGPEVARLVAEAEDSVSGC